MAGESGRERSLPLLPSGTTLFDDLPSSAIVLDALAPAVGDGVITLRDGARTGILIIQGGAVVDALAVDGDARTTGDRARASMAQWNAARVSASRLTDDAMALMGPLLRGEPRYTDLRLAWTVWAELLNDLRSRGGTFVVELCTPEGRGVILIRDGAQSAAYTDSHPSLGGPDLLDRLAASGHGEVRVLADSGAVLVARESPSISAVNRSDAGTPTEVANLLPDLKLLVRKRLQRSSGPVEDVIEAAAADGRSLGWLADQVRAMRVRGFMPATFERLADDMIELSRRTGD